MSAMKNYKQTELGLLPEDWEVKRLGEIANIIMGQSPPGESYNTLRKGIPLINGPTEFTKKFPIKKQWTTQPTKMCKKDDLLLCVRGSSTGRTNTSNDNYCIGRGVAAIRATKNSDIIFLTNHVYLAIEKILSLSSGSTFPNIDRKSLTTIPIPVPPLAEQKAIAKVLSDTDALIQSTEKLIAKKKLIKKGAMQELLTGKKRLGSFPKGKTVGREQTELGHLPEDWEVKELGEVCEKIIDGTHHTPTYVKQGVPFYSVENITLKNFRNTKFISEEEHLRLIKRCKPMQGDILMTRITAGILGDTKLIDWDVYASIYVSLAILRTNSNILTSYLYRYSKSSNFIKSIEKRSLINATPKKINMQDIRKVPIPLPPLPEQKAIAEVLSNMDAEIEALEKKLQKQKQIKQGMMQELLTGRMRLID
ncbi:MAG: restriction endonuclease subunit S [Spirochaetota bacterium]